MTTESPPIHATCVDIGGVAILLRGPSGSGKSDLALRLIDRGATLVSDDYTCLTAERGQILASPPERIAGKLEVRGLGIQTLPYHANVAIGLIANLDQTPERLPDCRTQPLLGVPIPVIAISAFEASAPIKLEMALSGCPDHE